MISRNYFYFFLIILFCFSCSKKEIKKSKINEKSIKNQELKPYQEGIDYQKDGDALYTAVKFNEAEL